MTKQHFQDFEFPVQDHNFDPPVRESSEIKLIIVDAGSGTIHHDYFYNLGNYLLADDLLVFNDVGISPSRVMARTVDGQSFDLCFLLVDPEDSQCWDVVVLAEDEAPRSGEFTALDGQIAGVLYGKSRDFDGGYWVQRSRYDGYRGRIRLSRGAEGLRELLDQYGAYMHPWYADINKLEPCDLNPPMARKTGGVLLSEPSRRISPEMMKEYRQRGMEDCYISLWMSFSWNQATPDTDLSTYKMNPEEFEVSERCVSQVLKAKAENRRVISIGTSGVRALESLPETPKATTGRTDIFIHPGSNLRFCSGLLTNLHNSMGTHVIMASAFAGTDLVVEACEQAVARNYYFGINGDSMLLISHPHQGENQPV